MVRSKGESPVPVANDTLLVDTPPHYVRNRLVYEIMRSTVGLFITKGATTLKIEYDMIKCCLQEIYFDSILLKREVSCY